MSSVTALTPSSQVTAIWTTKTGCNCEKCRTERHQYHAAVKNDDGYEQYVQIDEIAYDILEWQADVAYTEGDYISFVKPVVWGAPAR